MSNLRTTLWGAITLLGLPVLYLLVIVALWLVWWSAALWVAVIMVLVELAGWTIKLFYRKDRPSPQSREGFFRTIDANSFPSIHTARVAGIALALYFLYPYVWILILGGVMVTLVGYSRIYLKKHYLIDVVGGALLGIAIAGVIHSFLSWNF